MSASHPPRADRPRVTPVILSGGAGSRLWPLSTESRPKQFHALGGADTMLRQTLDRVTGQSAVDFAAPIMIGSHRHSAISAAELAAAGHDGARLLLEPVARNTAAALAAVSVLVADQEPDALLLVLPADHVIARPDALASACAQAAGAAMSGRIVTFGIVPDRPETGYGYIRRGAEIADGVFAIDSFREKPDLATAESYLASGDYAWNAGIFLFRASAMMDELARHAPVVLAAAQGAVEAGAQDGNVLALDGAAFSSAPAISIDYAVMERTAQGAVVPVDMGWSDVGSFATIWDLSAHDEAGNALSGPARAFDARNCLVRADTVPVAVIGLDDIVVVATAEGVLVAPRSRAQDVRLAADAFKTRAP